TSFCFLSTAQANTVRYSGARVDVLVSSPSAGESFSHDFFYLDGIEPVVFPRLKDLPDHRKPLPRVRSKLEVTVSQRVEKPFLFDFKLRLRTGEVRNLKRVEFADHEAFLQFFADLVANQELLENARLMCNNVEGFLGGLSDYLSSVRGSLSEDKSLFETEPVKSLVTQYEELIKKKAIIAAGDEET